MKVLIVSHNPMSTYNGMGKTIYTFFSAFEPTELCQFYIFPSYPDVDICQSYYRITDKEVLRSLVSFKLPGGKVSADKIGGEPAVFEDANDEKIYRNKKNKRPFRIMLRDAMWKCSHWYNRRLKQWLKEESPDCIFLAPGGAKFIYDVALKIAKKQKIPIVTYIADEYYFVSPDKGILGKLQLRSLQKKIRKTLMQSAHVVTISREFEELYQKTFGCKTTTIMTGSDYPLLLQPRVNDPVRHISYFGNIAYHRYVSLSEIGQVLDEINDEWGSSVLLDIYSAETDEEAMRMFEGVRSVRWHGFVSGEKFKEKFLSADILLHVESFDQRSIDIVKHSVSTKIADVLTVGIPFLAYGPENISSMNHLFRNDCALVATSHKNLKNVLKTALKQRSERIRVAQNALHTAAEYHDKRKNSAKLRKILEETGEQANE